MMCDIFIFLPFIAKIICLGLSYDGNPWNIVLFPRTMSLQMLGAAGH